MTVPNFDCSLFCSGGRGTEKFIGKELVSKLNCADVTLSDGKVFFKTCEDCCVVDLLNLKSVERIFVDVNSFKTSRLPYGKGKGQFVNALKRRLVKKQKFLKSLEILQKLQTQNGSKHLEPENKRQRLNNWHSDERGNENTDVFFRASVKISGGLTRLISAQELNIELGKYISRTTGWKVDLANPQIEISVHINDESVLCGIPLTGEPISKRSYILYPGLRSTISWILADLAQIKDNDVVLDPMCGKATILIEAANSMQRDCVYFGADINKHQLIFADKNRQHAGLNTVVNFINTDSLDLPLREESVNIIICDAPFGEKYTTNFNIHQFYIQLLQEFNRVLKSDGRMVLLTSSKLRNHVLQILKYEERNVSCADSSNGHLDVNPQNTKLNCPENSVFENKATVNLSTGMLEHSNTGYKTLVNAAFRTKVSTNDILKDEKKNYCDIPEINLVYKEDHYVKLGETHAYIIVADKMVIVVE